MATAKTRELSLLDKQYADMKSGGDGHNLNPLAMSLAGAVDSPVNGGLVGYMELVDDEKVAVVGECLEDGDTRLPLFIEEMSCRSWSTGT